MSGSWWRGDSKTAKSFPHLHGSPEQPVEEDIRPIFQMKGLRLPRPRPQPHPTESQHPLVTLLNSPLLPLIFGSNRASPTQALPGPHGSLSGLLPALLSLSQPLHVAVIAMVPGGTSSSHDLQGSPWLATACSAGLSSGHRLFFLSF